VRKERPAGSRNSGEKEVAKMFLIKIKDVLPIGAELQQIHIHEEGKVVDLYYQVYNQHWVAKVWPSGEVEYNEWSG